MRSCHQLYAYTSSSPFDTLQESAGVEQRFVFLSDKAVVTNQHGHLYHKELSSIQNVLQCTHVLVKWQTVRKFWGHIKILGLVLLAHRQQHRPNGPLILFIHTCKING